MAQANSYIIDCLVRRLRRGCTPYDHRRDHCCPQDDKCKKEAKPRDMVISIFYWCPLGLLF